MAVVNRDRDTVVATRLLRAETILTRMRGLLGRDGLEPGEAMWIAPCSGIHTIGMRFTIDALFLDREGRVLRRFDRLVPGRLGPSVRGAAGVLELPEGAAAASDTQAGDRLVLDAPANDG